MNGERVDGSDDGEDDTDERMVGPFARKALSSDSKRIVGFKHGQEMEEVHLEDDTEIAVALDKLVEQAESLEGCTSTILHDSIVAHLRAVRLSSLKKLIEEEESQWFRDRPHATMYDVCPELLIPRTTCREWIVKLAPGDVDRLAEHFNSPSDLTLRSSVEVGEPPVWLDSKRGSRLTLQGVLRTESPDPDKPLIRRQYWSWNKRRDEKWQTTEVHGRRPDEELQELPAELAEAGCGEVEVANLDALRELEPGAVVVFRLGVSYAELFGQTPLDTFVSHWWGEPTLEFYAALKQHAHAPGRKGDEQAYWICTFANSQHHVELGDHWKRSPFNQAMENECCQEVVMVVDKNATPFSRIWCIFELFRCTVLRLSLEIYCRHGLVSAAAVTPGPNGQEGEHSGTAVVPFPSPSRFNRAATNVQFLNSVCFKIVSLDLREATATREEDRRMIYNAIWRESSFEEVTFKVKRLFLDYKTCMGALQMASNPLTGAPLDLLNCKGLLLRRREVTLQRSVQARLGRCCMAPQRKEVKDFYREVLQAGQSRRVVIQGPAGSGKTVLTKQLMKLACEDDDYLGIPVRIGGAELAKVLSTDSNDERPVLERWARRCFSSFADPVLDSEQSLLLLLDGLDESGQLMDAVMRWLETVLVERRNLQKQKAITTTCIVTCRPEVLRGTCLKRLSNCSFTIYELSKMRKNDLHDMYEVVDEETTGFSAKKTLRKVVSTAFLQPSCLWDRPLMAMMLRQYFLSHYSHSTAEVLMDQLNLKDAVDEIEILEFAVNALTDQGAEAVESVEQHEVRGVFSRLALKNQKAYGGRFIEEATVFSEEVSMPAELWNATKCGRLVLVDTADRTPQFVHGVFQEYLAARQSLETADLGWLGWGLVAPHHHTVGRKIGAILAKAPANSNMFLGGRACGVLGMIITSAGNVHALHGLLQSDALQRQPIGEAQTFQFLIGYFWNPFRWDPRLAFLSGMQSGFRVWFGMLLASVVLVVPLIVWLWPVTLGVCLLAWDDNDFVLIAAIASICAEVPWFVYLTCFERALVIAMLGDKPLQDNKFFSWTIGIIQAYWNMMRRLVLFILADSESFPEFNMREPEGAAVLFGSSISMLKYPVLLALVALVPLWRLLLACRRLRKPRARAVDRPVPLP